MNLEDSRALVAVDGGGVEGRPSRAAERSKKLIRVALVGVSGFADVHLKMIQRGVSQEEFCLVSATVINPEEEVEKCEAIERMGGRIFGDFAEMIGEVRGGIDLLFVPTGIHLHAPMVIAGLEAGANVFVEKPAAATIQDVLRMKEVSERTGKFVAVGFQDLYDESVHWMKERVLAGAIGAVKSIKTMGLWPRSDRYYGRNDWAGRMRVRDEWMLDSPFNNALAHQLNLICFFAGETSAKSARLRSIRAELYRARRIESVDTAFIRAETEGGVPLFFMGSHVSREQMNPVVVVVGEKGELRWDKVAAEWVRPDGGVVEQRKNSSWAGLRGRILSSLIDRTGGGDAFLCDLEVAKPHTVAVNAAHESMAIQSIPASLVEEYESSGEHWVAVDGLEDLMQECFRREVLLSELGGVPWAKAGADVDVRGYVTFPSLAGRMSI